MRWIQTSNDQPGVPGIEVNVPSRAWLLADLEDRLGAGQGFCLATLNLDHIVKLRKSKDFYDAYHAHSHVTADGRPIVWLSRLAGQHVELVPGSDLMLPMIEMAQRLQIPVAFFGSTQETLETTAKHLRQVFSELKIVACISPSMGFDPQGSEANRYIDQILASEARMVFVALGAPKQEIFARKIYAVAPHIGFASIGAGIDFIAGTQKRAPRLVRIMAAEWLWRLGGNPRRLFWRYMACFMVLPALTVRAVRGRLSRDAGLRVR